MKSFEYRTGPDAYIPPRDNAYAYQDFRAETWPEGTLLARQIQALSYLANGFVRPEGIMIEDGVEVLAPDIATPSEAAADTSESVWIEYSLGIAKGSASMNPRTDKMVAWRKYHAPLEALPAYRYSRDTLWPGWDDYLHRVDADPILELAETEGLGKTSNDPGVIKEFMRNEIQRALGKGEVWLMGLVEKTVFQSWVRMWGPIAVKQIGDPKPLHHPHVQDIRLVPTVMDIDRFFDDYYQHLKSQEDGLSTKQLTDFVYMADGVSDDALGREIAAFRAQARKTLHKRRKDALDHWMKTSSTPTPRVWSEPDRYDLNDAADRRSAYARMVMDGFTARPLHEEVIEELFKLRHPDKLSDKAAYERFRTPIDEAGNRYGMWFHFPWRDSKELIQYPDREQYLLLRTARHRDLMTVEEQRRISIGKTVMYTGLSVGMNVFMPAAHMGLGDKVILADPDVISPTNLNRISAGMPEVGEHKTDKAGIYQSELDPYVKQIHLRGGMSPEMTDLVVKSRPDIIYEHVDHLPTKILMRKIARQLRVPLIMATDVGDRSLIDVERYDLEDVKPFLGRLTDEELERIESQTAPPGETLELIQRIIGHENISKRMKDAMGRIGVTLSGIPQLGTTAVTGGAYAAVAGREILLGRGPASGRYVVSPQYTLQLSTNI